MSNPLGFGFSRSPKWLKPRTHINSVTKRGTHGSSRQKRTFRAVVVPPFQVVGLASVIGAAQTSQTSLANWSDRYCEIQHEDRPPLSHLNRHAAPIREHDLPCGTGRHQTVHPNVSRHRTRNHADWIRIVPGREANNCGNYDTTNTPDP
jgi:hypothetical protein